MTLGEYIKKYKEEHEMSGRAFAALVGISPQYASNLEKGKNNQGKPLSPSIDIYKKIAKATGVDENAFFSMLNDRIEVTHRPPVRSDLIEQYDALDEHGKEVVKAVLKLEYARCVGEKEKPVAKIIPLFPAAAGPGEPQEGNAFDSIEATDERADFAVRISGDSMLPYFEPGEIVMCKNKIEFETGEIVVVMVNGFLLVKQFYEGYNGQWYLRSLNRERSNLDYDYIPSSTDTPAPYGVVIHKRIPLVEQ